MVMTAHAKSAFRLLKKHLTRFITIIAIVIVSVGFMSGIGEVENKIKISTNKYYISQNISDLYLKSSNAAGFSDTQLNWIQNKFGQKNIMQSFCFETKINEDIIRVYNYNFESMQINKLELKDGSMPNSNNQVLVERKTSKIKGYDIGDKINIYGTEYTVCGIVLNPYILNQIEEPSFIFENDHLDNVVYINTSTLPIVNDIYITLQDRTSFDCFDKEYKSIIDNFKQEITQEYSDITVLSLYENFGIYSLINYAEKVGLIGIIFVIFFLLVTLLVVYSTMTRLLDEERSQIACLKTLGYSDIKILNKYILFVLISTLIGGLLAFGVGYALTKIIYIAFNLQYAMPPFPNTLNFLYYLVTLLIITFSTTILTFFTGKKIVKTKPVLLLKPKIPKSGKKVVLEKIPFIWNKLSFKYKSTLRNVLLFKSRFFMTIISVIGSTVLLFAGMGLMDCATKIEASSSLISISAALIVFSAVLCALVIYNLTNINISERNREIATLMVLGYHNKEVTGYIYREIYIMCFIGAILGVPLGFGFVEFVFKLINFGSTSDINWWTWILTPLITMFFSFLSTLLLRKKIIKTNMNASLKSIE